MLIVERGETDMLTIYLAFAGAAIAASVGTTSPSTGAHVGCGLPSTCPAVGICLRFPLVGRRSEDWVINHYVDLDHDADSVLDFMGHEHTYDGHQGTDISVPNMRWVDYEVPVYAAAYGRVIVAIDDHPDREVVNESRPANKVVVQHGDAYRTIYAHLKQHRVEVKVGDLVGPETVVGYVASSGNSSGAHLHFAVARNDTTVDPFLEELWDGCREPAYERPFRYMAMSVQPEPIPSQVEVRRPPDDDINEAHAGDEIGIGLSTGGGTETDRLSSCVTGPDDFRSCRMFRLAPVRSPYEGKKNWIHNLTLGGPGEYEIVVRENGDVVDRHALTVLP